MTWQDTLFMGQEPYEAEPRERLAQFLRSQYRDGFAVKRLANGIRCTTKTAENILNGHWPNSRHMQRIVRIFGRDVLEAVFAPDINAVAARLRRGEAELEKQLLQKRAQRLQMEGGDAVAQERDLAVPTPEVAADIIPLPSRGRK